MEMLRNMQFSAMLVMSLLTLALAVLPRRVARQRVADRSRWLMAGATGLLALQFAIQYSLNLRSQGVTQAVILNLVFFIPASVLKLTAVLNLQRQGHILRREWLIGVMTWVVTVLLLAGAALLDGQPLFSDTSHLRIAETVGSILFALMQGYYSWLTLREMRRMRRTIAAYYDSNISDILKWMERSVWLLALMATLVPLMIFSSDWPLRLFGILFFIASFYLVICFICYMVSSDHKMVTVAEEVETVQENVTEDDGKEQATGLGQDQHDDDNTPSAYKHVEDVAAQWVVTGGHLHQGLNIQTVADEMHLPRPLLTAWLKTTEWELFATWLTHLRIEEAKKVLREHRDWNNDYVAQHCGFSNRQYFHKKFKELTGLTPSEWQEGKGE